MKTCYTILSAASIIPLLSSCASYQKTAESETWRIKPIYSVRHSTETPESYYQLGRYYQGQNRFEQALASYQKALSIDNLYAEARNGLGVIYAMQGRQKEAVEQFRIAVKQAPDSAHIHNNLGYALYLSGSYPEAVSTLERAVALEPANQSVHANLALALDKAGGREKAMQVIAAHTAKPQLVENAPPVNQEVQRVSAGTPLPIPVPSVAKAAVPVPAPQPVLALQKEWGVITQPAPKPVSVAASSNQLVKVAFNVSELRRGTEVHVQAAPATKPLQQVSVQQKERNTVVAQAAQKLVAAAEIRTQPARQVSNVTEQRVQAAAPADGLYRIEVANGNGVTAMARKVAGFLVKKGYSNARLTNQKPFQVTSSQVQYRSGYREQAQSLALALPGQPGITQTNNLRGDISVKVLLGKDLSGKVAYFEQNQGKIRLARYGSDS